jgi:hypothetical protein
MAIELTEEQKLQYNELMAAYAARVDDREWCRLVDRADPVVADAVDARDTVAALLFWLLLAVSLGIIIAAGHGLNHVGRTPT